jgi:cyclic beta-1,2-glucan synthetase
MRFIGRGRTRRGARAMDGRGACPAAQGSVLDPMVAIRSRITLEPDQTVSVDLVYGIGDSRDVALGLVEKYQDQRLADRVFDLAWTHARWCCARSTRRRRTRNSTGAWPTRSSMPMPRCAPSSVLMRNRRGQSGLWGYAMSGDLPIVLLRIGDLANIELVRQLIQAHAYWRLKGLAVDLVIWNEDRAGYRQQLQDQILGLVAVGLETQVMDRPGGIFVRSADQISDEDRILFQTVARVILSDSRGTLAEQVNRPTRCGARAAPADPARPPTGRSRPNEPAFEPAAARSDPVDNGIGGFTPDGREYVITTARTGHAGALGECAGQPQFGSVVSESGQAYTWGENAHEFRLTPWHNDPVTDASGEAFYLRDEASGHFWSPTPLPRRRRDTLRQPTRLRLQRVRAHRRRHPSELWVYVALDAAVKFSVLKVRNTCPGGRAGCRRPAMWNGCWVTCDPRSAMHVITESIRTAARSMRATPTTPSFPTVSPSSMWTTEPDPDLRPRRIHRPQRNLENPAAMTRTHLSGRSAAGLDPCAAIQVGHSTWPTGRSREIVFRLGVGGRARWR